MTRNRTKTVPEYREAWTRTRPSVAGLYWWKRDGDALPGIVRLWQQGKEWRWTMLEDSYVWGDGWAPEDSWWWGPFSPPPFDVG